MSLLLYFTRSWTELRKAGKNQWLRMTACGLLITANWGLFVFTVNSGHVAEAALGYFINPLFSVALGMIFLRERLPGTQITAVLVALVGVGYLTFLIGQPPFIGLGLALTFGFYGLIKKGVRVSTTGSLAAETLVITPFAIAFIAYLEISGQGTFFNNGPSHMMLLIISGLVTALPLLAFGQATKLIPLSTIGMMQFINPTMQMLWAVFVVHETMDSARWIGYIIIWFAVLIYIGSIAVQQVGKQRTQRKQRTQQRATIANLDPE